MYSPEEARVFIRALTGSVDTPVHFQCYFDPSKHLGLSPGPDAYAEEWFSTFDESLDFINFKQDADCGVYICINETDGQGREESNITGLRCFMVDFDGMEEPQWTIQPHIINMRDETHGHAFWLCDFGDLTKDEWSVMQRRLALFYGTDTQVIDPCRVIRLPGSKHLKNPNKPAEYRIVEDNSELPLYTIDEIRDHHILSAQEDAKLNKWIEARQGIMDGTGFDDNEREIAKFVRFLGNANPAVDGTGATHEVIRVALFAFDHGISYETCCELMWEHYNPRCEPPWEDNERDHFEDTIRRGYKYATSVPGCKTTKAAFSSLPKVVEPEGGWTAYREAQVEREEPHLTLDDMKYVKPVLYVDREVTRDPRRISHEDSQVMMCQLTGKSPHYAFAESFDGYKYDGVNIIRNQKAFYRYEGDHWATIDDDVVRAEIQRCYSKFAPSHSLTNGIFKVFCDFVNAERNLEVGKFMGDPETCTDNLAVFQNGIVDFTGDTPVMSNHTPDLFNLNVLPHSYNPDAECPHWIDFLNEVFDQDQQIIEQLRMWFGYCLTSDVSLEKFALFKGPTGSGKGTITTMLSQMIGMENIAAPSIDRVHTNSALEEMAKKSVAMIPEAEEIPSNIKTAVLGTLKAVIGGDAVSYHEMYKGSRNSVFKLKIVMTTNKMPKFNDPSGALVARALVFPMFNSYRERQDHTLKPRLLSEIEGVTNWAIEGLRKLRANGNRFIEAERGLKEKRALKEDMSPLSQFFKKMCHFEEEGESTIEQLYSVYRLWAASTGVSKPMPQSHFHQSVRDSMVPVTPYETPTDSGFKGVIVKHDISTGNVLHGQFGKVRK